MKEKERCEGGNSHGLIKTYRHISNNQISKKNDDEDNQSSKRTIVKNDRPCQNTKKKKKVSEIHINKL